ncbi:DUF459 domain-containing protein [Campylobacter cuniculorum]|uniref:SGNH/GDSL hydrolase family protein n=1 Tax=Campylobacter cuniculorum TaxID=374106 RepID=UPI0023F479D0|nr:DUF459 domain-containing protein [Campylobacter cuniculorum]
MSVLRFFFILIVVFILVVLVMNQSISSYIEQKYHFVFYPQNDILKEANSLKVKLEQIRAILNDEPLSQNNKTQADTKTNDDEEIITLSLELPTQDENLSLENNILDVNQSLNEEKIDEVIKDENISFIDNTKIQIKEGEEFLLIGDSLMQGAAIALSRDLKDLGIKATDLSKQNTGLSYKSYFNWANATNSALNNNHRIKYLVVLLGVNDPWDIKKGGVYHRFNTPGWIEIYTERVKEIIDIAKKHRVKIFWFEIPPVKKEDLNKKIQVLNQIYSSEILKNNEILVNTKLFFSVNNAFSSYIKDENNKSTKVRTDDGIHFTPRGAKEISKLLLEHIYKD